MSEKDEERIDDVTRRALVGALGAGAAGSMAGCFGDNGGTETPTAGNGNNNGGETDDSTPTATPSVDELAHVEGQTLTIPWGGNPEEHSFVNPGAFPFAVRGSVGMTKPWDVGMELGMRGPWSNSESRSTEKTMLSYESVDIAADELTVEVRSDASWSNGDDLLAKDFLGQTLAFRLFPNVQSFDAAAENGVALPVEAVTGFEYDGKTLTLTSNFDGFGEIIESNVLLSILTGWEASLWGLHPTPRISPYTEWKSAIEEHFEKTKAGDVDPWNNSDESIQQVAHPPWQGGEVRGAGVSDELWEKFRQPANIVTNGAFTVSAYEGNQAIRFQKNEEYYNADKVNFDEVVLEVHQEDRAIWAALRGDHLDFHYGQVPTNVANSFPDNYTQVLNRANSGACLAVNHDKALFEDRRARQAILYALNTDTIARTIHSQREKPVKTPGGHTWGIENWVDSSFIDETLQSYEQDLEKAASLMEDAGFSREGGNWVTPGGDPVSTTFATTKDTPKAEVSVVNQLNNFGIQSSVQTVNQSTFNQNRDNGELAMWNTNWGVGWTASGLARFYSLIVEQKQWTKWHNIYPDQQVEQTEYLEDGLIAEATPEAHSAYTVEAPPVGKPNGNLKEWEVGRISYAAWIANSKQQYKNNVRKLAWIFNYNLPFLPLTQSQNQIFMDTGHWFWPAEDAKLWQWSGVNWTAPHQMVPNGDVQANPDNPEEGASVQN